MHKGHSVAIISSTAEKQKEVENLVATAAIGDIEDADFFAKTFIGADIVYCMETMDRTQMFDPNFTLTNMLVIMDKIANSSKPVILKSGVTKVIHLCSIGAHKLTHANMLKEIAKLLV